MHSETIFISFKKVKCAWRNLSRLSITAWGTYNIIYYKIKLYKKYNMYKYYEWNITMSFDVWNQNLLKFGNNVILMIVWTVT